MPAYGVPQSGSAATVSFDATTGAPVNTPTPGLNLRQIFPGDFYKLFDAETVAASSKSVAFARGNSPSMSDQGITFEIDFAAAPTAVVAIQGSNIDLEADYQDLYTSADTQHDNYTDTVRWAFYRARVVSYSAGGALSITARR